MSSQVPEIENSAVDEIVDVKAILSDPSIEGDPLSFLKVTEAYWRVRSYGPSHPQAPAMCAAVCLALPDTWVLALAGAQALRTFIYSSQYNFILPFDDVSH